MRAAAIDLGRVRVGVAVSDELGLIAHPRPHLPGRDHKALIAELGRLARDEGLSRFLVGLPRDLGGREGPPARRARRFAEQLERGTGVQVELVDERLSTKEAESRLRASGASAKEQRDRIDSAAAAVLLQAWLDARSDRDE